MKACYLCALLNANQGIVWQCDDFFAVFDTHPVSPGHMLIVAKKHVDNFDKIDGKAWLELRKAVNKAIKIIEDEDLVQVYKKLLEDHETNQSIWFCQKALKNLGIRKKPQGYNHGFNDGKAAGRTVDHFHWHVIPRYESDMKAVKGGIRFVIPKMGVYQ